MARLVHYRPVLAAIALGTAVGALPGHAAPRMNFDGAWSVLIITDAGACDRAYRYGVRISQGRVLADGGADGGSVQIWGRVDRNGRVEVSLRSGDRQAVGTGRLFRETGAGQWSGSSPTDQCSGRWQAERRD